MDRSTHLLTPTSLKALAHPIRVQLLGLLRTDGPATATGLAARLGESSGTTSYHLRQLAAADFVVEISDRGNGRERWWRAAQHSTRLEPADWQDDPEVRPALETYLGAVVTTHVSLVQDWFARWVSAPKKWRDAATVSDALLPLSATELARLNAEIEAVVERFRREPKRGDEKVVVQWQSFPVASEP